MIKIDYKEMCIRQGYVPSYCKLDGIMVWLLIQEGKNPCKGCNCDCDKRIPETKYIEQYEKEYKQRCKREQEKRKRCKKHLDCNPKVIMSITVDMYGRDGTVSEIKINNLINECGYVKYCKSMEETIYIALHCISIYGVEQIQIETNGFGIVIYDALSQSNLNVDIVPIHYTAIKI